MYTKGPWKAFNSFGKDIYPDDDDTQGRKHIAELCPEGWDNEDCDITYEEAKANARLIAAAPELLRALVRLTSVESVPSEYGQVEFDSEEYYEAHSEALAVIAKATGE